MFTIQDMFAMAYLLNTKFKQNREEEKGGGSHELDLPCMGTQEPSLYTHWKSVHEKRKKLCVKCKHSNGSQSQYP